MSGLVVTQYHPESGSSYPLSTYSILLFQTLLSAVSGVYNQKLCQTNKASVNVNNMALYAPGAAINIVCYVAIRLFRPDEPGFFSGYNSIGALMVIVSNVFLGLAMTAVYKCMVTGCISVWELRG